MMETLPRGAAARASRRSKAAFADSLIPGRMEVYPGHPTVVFDIAHNAEKAEQLVALAAGTLPKIVTSPSSSRSARVKMRAEILRALASLPANFVVHHVSTTAVAKPTNPMRLLRIAESLGTWGRCVARCRSRRSAVARRNAAANDVDRRYGLDLYRRGIAGMVAGRGVMRLFCAARASRGANATYLMAIVNVTPDSFSGDGARKPRRRSTMPCANGTRAPTCSTSAANRRVPVTQPVDEASNSRAWCRSLRVCASVCPTCRISVDTYKTCRRARGARRRRRHDQLRVGSTRSSARGRGGTGDADRAMHNQTGTHYDEDVVDAVTAVPARLRGRARSAAASDPNG